MCIFRHNVFIIKGVAKDIVNANEKGSPPSNWVFGLFLAKVPFEVLFFAVLFYIFFGFVVWPVLVFVVV